MAILSQNNVRFRLGDFDLVQIMVYLLYLEAISMDLWGFCQFTKGLTYDPL
jgi:hypothetical protein